MIMHSSKESLVIAFAAKLVANGYKGQQYTEQTAKIEAEYLCGYNSIDERANLGLPADAAWSIAGARSFGWAA